MPEETTGLPFSQESTFFRRGRPGSRVCGAIRLPSFLLPVDVSGFLLRTGVNAGFLIACDH
ncbi:hypothetical protein [Ktedonobacter racemifer]|uniref:Uncharacterized protein n=1 Tax=Ktedonobacter racemifer DSM 44963 TaxID=485913 RepID=D6TUQ8_KTERA|nr:hypothetical protein [Ktedonobacter racemifer]EFH85234.1 hypothetical protein Krac_6413 [Ktedonobacter racemifer DSM 44963]